MKKPALIIALVHVAALFALCFLPGCVSSTSTGVPTSSEQSWANGVGDFLSLGLAPVLANNPDYIPAAQALGATLGTFTGDTLTPDNVAALVATAAAKAQGFSVKDQKTVTALINAAWARYAKNYQGNANAAIRPDVKLFLAAAADGIAAAVAATPRS